MDNIDMVATVEHIINNWGYPAIFIAFLIYCHKVEFKEIREIVSKLESVVEQNTIVIKTLIETIRKD